MAHRDIKQIHCFFYYEQYFDLFLPRQVKNVSCEKENLLSWLLSSVVGTVWTGDLCLPETNVPIMPPVITVLMEVAFIFTHAGFKPLILFTGQPNYNDLTEIPAVLQIKILH